MTNMFFKKPDAPKQKEYDLEIDNIKNVLGVAINLQAFLDRGDKFVSIEREGVNSENERTIVYTVEKDGSIADNDFYVSRLQHKEMVSQFNGLIKAHD